MQLNLRCMPYKNPKSPAAIASKKKAAARYAENHPDRVEVQKRGWHEKNRDKTLARLKQNRCPEREAAGHLRRKYGLELEQFLAMVETQGGACAICLKPPSSGRWKKLHVDHEHATGKVRGLLCHRCNMLLGYAVDSEGILEAAMKYLRKSRN